MTGLAKLEETIAKLEAATEECRQATREAHEAWQQLREERKEVDRLLGQRAADLVEDRVAALVKTELEAIGPQLRDLSNGLYDRMAREADRLVDLCLGKEWAVEHGREDLRPRLAAKLREWIVEVMHSVDDGPRVTVQNYCHACGGDITQEEAMAAFTGSGFGHRCPT